MADQITNKMKGRATIIDQNISDLLGYITVSTKAELPGQIKVFGNRQKMKASYEVIAPPIYTKIINPIKDTYVRSDKEAFSYGTNSTLHTGTMGEDINTQSFMGFDLKTGFTSTTILTSAKLRLYITNLDSAGSQISLYKIDKDWQENNTTYLNKPNKLDLITTKDIKAGISYIDIDISDYIKEAFKNPDNNYGFEFEVSDSAYPDKAVYSKEAKTELKPILTLKFYDLNDLVDSSDLYGQVTVTQKGISDLNSQIKVRTINVTDSNYIEGSIKISKKDQPGQVKVLGKSDLVGEVKIESPGIEDLLGQIEVTKDKFEDVADLLGAQIVISKKDELGSVDVSTTRTTNSDLNGVIKVGRYIFGKLDQDASINIKRTENNDLNGQIKVSTTRTTNNDLIGGQVIISKRDQLGEVFVIPFKDGSSEISGQVLITVKDKSELSGDTKIINKKTLNSDLSGNINIKRAEKTEIEGSISVVEEKYYASEVEGSIHIKRNEVDDQYAKINISKRDGYDLLGEVKIDTYRFKGFTQIIYR